MSPKLKCWLALKNIPKIGPVKIKKLLDQFNTIEEVCSYLKADFSWALAEIERAKKQNIKIFCPDDARYPENLKNIPDPPPVIYVRGEIKKEDKKALAIVGTRAATSYGREIAKKFAAELSSMGITIVSGLALGIDTAAHAGANRTIAVFGSGIDQVYPRSNQRLADSILEKGALVSEFPIGTLPDKWTFPQRNRIISGLSLGVIVVEGAEDSGALITAKLALDQGREVFAVPGNIQFKQSKGPNSLIKQGARLVEDISDILEELEPQLGRVSLVNKNKSETDLSKFSKDEQQVLRSLLNEAKHIDAVTSETGFGSAKTSSLLAMLEIKQIVKQLPGKMFALNTSPTK